MHKGSAITAGGTKRFVEEPIARVRPAGAAGEVVVRFDSGFWSKKTIEIFGRLDAPYTMALRANNSAVAKAIAAIDESAGWTSTTPRRRGPGGGVCYKAGAHGATHPPHRSSSGSALAPRAPRSST